MGVDDVTVAYPLFQEESGGPTPTSTLQLSIYEIPLDVAKALNARWHSRLPEYRTGCRPRQHAWVCFGAECSGIYYAAAIWSHPNSRALDDRQTMELRRLAISSKSPKNTASRMISVMVREIRKMDPRITRFISYQDTEAHTGTIYKASGWVAMTQNNAMDYTHGGKRSRPNQEYMAAKIRWERNLTKHKGGHDMAHEGSSGGTAK